MFKKSFDFDVIVIGSGVSGGLSAHLLAKAGLKVGLVEKGELGGDSLHFGAVPEAVLRESARRYSESRGNLPFGVRNASITYNFPSIKARKDHVVQRLSSGRDTFKHDSIAVIKGEATFESENKIRVDGAAYTAKNFVVATGSSPKVPKIEDIDEVGYITYKQVFDLSTPPRSTAIIGSGYEAINFACYLSSLGSKVTIIFDEKRLLPDEDESVDGFLRKLFKTRDIDVITEASVNSAEKMRGKKTLRYTKHAKSGEVSADEIMIACGRTPNIELNFESAGVKYLSDGVKVSDSMQTSNKSIFAVGDVTGNHSSHNNSVEMAKVACANIVNGSNAVAYDENQIFRTLSCQPDICMLGLSEEQAKQGGYKPKTSTALLAVAPVSEISGQHYGFAKLICSKNGQLIGAVLALPNAQEIAPMLQLLINNGMSSSALADTSFEFLSFGEVVKIAAQGL